MLIGILWLSKIFNNEEKDEKSLFIVVKNISMKYYLFQTTEKIYWEMQHSE